MANLRISILDNFLSGGKVGSNLRRSVNAELKASTRMRSRDAWAERYLGVARRRRRRSSRDKIGLEFDSDFTLPQLPNKWKIISLLLFTTLSNERWNLNF